MRIAIVSNKRSGLGGMEAVFRTVMQELGRNQDEVKMFLMGGSLDKDWLQDIDHVEIGDQRTDNALRRRYSFTLPLFRQIRQYKPDVIIGCDPNVVCYCKWMIRILNRKIPVGSLHFCTLEVWRTEGLAATMQHIINHPKQLPDPQFVKESVGKFSIANVVNNIRGIIDRELQLKTSS